ncbi:hypothetical protein GCM10022224_090430 [Nonomuraea antimicrobica]|uniref:PEP-CTERM protein-sorting domain-containing protein n=1 Tax=Nonomuraea antimicrobica TaxID=561173 RepID=A0ABP7E1E7_9ACTN
MSTMVIIKTIIALAAAVLTGGAAVVVARRSGKGPSAALLVGLTVGTAALGGVTPILFG